MQSIKDKNIKWWLGTMSCVVLFSTIGIFALMKMSFLLKGVQVEAAIERSGTAITYITGKAEHATHISLNGREIYIDKDGSFRESIALIPGFSVITINTEDKFGKSKEKKFQLVYKESAGTVAFNSK
ncbi:MAG: hypothetical protein UR85_C0005G0024 [Candidatus Nomurabacteria bacterium GW2011_GWF2_35_66]|uniref:Uncharacterized protein n=1 Tax=Candidatus Nomurabacteria bacterium GW2011_GWE1_35_16 TaxID=1618761 RepID=A0A0G0DTV4_9BACT|nr:MAG: hypothetical protein UR55_C0006G0025 [Candidatus Nomurabacteria bacterium GW2011_GWF1_34_20]KKP63253.1 MAG: hypothetical protein UR57_C0007G0025 [Candidatus Nomurabacteria bacterium GW2011_GWE2_34_25]KKP66455.1 MAG: hypothetical protein UR64_C0007G0024 [Candidatus Nomurabacteria bacterium GW2011_GWE1_35_16]KKP83349.1 MAG: hypothetical protein UR85_C0005G0024 [Candidatus Nomurabacteria bacterium GW2011_GWF2_35_66]HAE36468.1 hypothetical protein [Candidatus Nomurabacteria bacterium]